VITILTGVRGNLSVVLIWPGMVNIFHESFLAIWTSSLKKFCLVQLPTSLLVH
jgi:hypothetical protein